MAKGSRKGGMKQTTLAGFFGVSPSSSPVHAKGAKTSPRARKSSPTVAKVSPKKTRPRASTVDSMAVSLRDVDDVAYERPEIVTSPRIREPSSSPLSSKRTLIRRKAGSASGGSPGTKDRSRKRPAPREVMESASEDDESGLFSESESDAGSESESGGFVPSEGEASESSGEDVVSEGYEGESEGEGGSKVTMTPEERESRTSSVLAAFGVGGEVPQCAKPVPKSLRRRILAEYSGSVKAKAKGYVPGGEAGVDIPSRAQVSKDSLLASSVPKGSVASNFTPLERQFIAIKQDNPDTILAVECGYKYKFFGPDAVQAGQTLGIAVYREKAFMGASVPTHRIMVHARRLVSAGFTVGIVTQQETAALKKLGPSKSSTFVRKLTRVLTKATLVGEDEDDSSRVMVAVCDREGEVGLVALDITSGRLMFDQFSDSTLRLVLAARLAAINPLEIIHPKKTGVSTHTLSILSRSPCDLRPKPDKHFSSRRDGALPPELQQLPALCRLCVNALLYHLETFELAEVLQSCHSNPGLIVDLSRRPSALYLPPETTTALALAQPEEGMSQSAANQGTYTQGGTDSVYAAGGKYRGPFGSVLWALGSTLTSHGLYTLQTWVTSPLADAPSIRARHAQVAYLQAVLDGRYDEFGGEVRPGMVGSEEARCVTDTIAVLHKMPSLARSLSLLHTGRLSPGGLSALLTISLDFCEAVRGLSECEQCPLSIPKGLLSLGTDVDAVLKAVGTSQVRLAKADSARKVFSISTARLLEQEVGDIQREQERERQRAQGTAGSGHGEEVEAVLADLTTNRARLRQCESALEDALGEARSDLGDPTLQYKAVSGEEFLIEVGVRVRVPDDWVEISSTKAKKRYRTEFATELVENRAAAVELDAILSQRLFKCTLRFIAASSVGVSLRQVVDVSGRIDGLLTLARHSLRPNHVCPSVLDPPSPQSPSSVSIEGGRHPVGELILDGFVPNSVSLRGTIPTDTGIDTGADRCSADPDSDTDSDTQIHVISGPNAGGKSLLMRMVGSLVVMAQMGAWVPADSMSITCFEAVWVRQGANDDLLRHTSTFLAEVTEVKRALNAMSPRTLLLIDELGRGTSSRDGSAIAAGTLRHVHSSGVPAIFSSHHPAVLSVGQTLARGTTGHMAFEERDETPSRGREIVYLYRYTRGRSDRSYGMNVARLVGVKQDLVDRAQEMADAVNGRSDLERLLSAMTQG
ncbi:hypothetical protein KIPB_004378 [Kipferlia bialata]|uniref:DNA mismatch repair protein MSH3 n=1 Tax=Kipferlia bialata TaxID=797122 RepID=A0A9K3GGJ3_9EUKA|nr:hypothetical protein KIPB_004378 [Kipferlia bialata]|eukprot:g4378.t1